MKRKLLLIVLIALGMCLAACGPSRLGEGAPEATERQQAGLVEVTLMLDWVPNTNHTGIFVAEAKGYFEQAGLDVEIIQPGEVYAEQAVVGGAADFGVSFQEQLTMARADGAELVSIAAIIQHNTSGFASRAEQGVETPADWEGLRYGSYGSPFEQPTLSVLMQCAGGDFEQLEIVDTGFADPLALLDEQQTDLAWIFYAWQGVQAQLAGIELNVVMMEDWFDCIPDYYTPIFITSQQTIDEQPEIVGAFLEAISRGYEDAIEGPEEAADILLQAVPEMSQELVRTSQDWISPRYQADAPRWGEQSLSVWQDYADWMLAHGIITEQIDASQAFTNQFLPAR
ncbi:MAG: ABC transporter substrate-binding protein [Anaerolineales bacterium]|jgi:ABC-type nitrate/sulfonate/bicarbonate transport system substrate-binding protein